MLFSERYGYVTKSDVLQTDGMDDALRVDLWNVVFYSPLADLRDELLPISWDLKPLVARLWAQFFRWPLDAIPDSEGAVWSAIKQAYFTDLPWNKVYDFIEIVVGEFGDERPELEIGVNQVLQANLSAWRMSGGEFVPISSEEELRAITQAQADAAPFPGIRGHLRAAAEHMSDREAPDYRNSIKESISAVEATARLVTGNRKLTLGKALDELEKQFPMHGALRAACSKLYWYASDEKGVRHGDAEQSQVGLAEAKLMLVACSAFVSYFIEKATDAGIDLSAGVEAGGEG